MRWGVGRPGAFWAQGWFTCTTYAVTQGPLFRRARGLASHTLVTVLTILNNF